MNSHAINARARAIYDELSEKSVSPQRVQQLSAELDQLDTASRTADSGSRRNTSRRERNRSSVLSVAASGRWRALVRAGMPTRQGRCASLRGRPAAGP